MTTVLKIAALTAFAFIATGSVAQAGWHHGSNKTSSAQHHNSSHPQHASHSMPSGSHKPGKEASNSGHHHKPPFWHHHHHRHHEWRYAYSYYKPEGYRDYSYERRSYPAYTTQPRYVTYAPAPARAPASCLTKEYLKDGPVLFKDTCTKEWAIGDAAENQSVNPSCLRKDYLEGGKVVKFTDVCTKEWAMNPPTEQQANAPGAPPANAAEEDED